MNIILASGSPYRRQLLQRLQFPFEWVAPEVDETRRRQEAPAEMACRLALTKARSVARLYPKSLVIGSDQVAALDGAVMGKPGDHETAQLQLRKSSGREVVFYTGLALHCVESGLETFHVEPFTVHFRELDDKSIENYLQREQPYDCAGSFKWEGLGIALFAALDGRDPTSLEGLPLIRLTAMLAEAGFDVLGSPA